MTIRCALAPAAAAGFTAAVTFAAWAATPSDPCRVVSKADAATALGMPVTSVRPTTMGPSKSCAFRGVRPFQSVVVTAFRSDSVPEARARFSDLVKQTASAFSSAPAKLNGVGDEAVTIASNVYARKGTEAYVFNVFGTRGPALTARAVALAKATLDRIR
ncbi:MAG: hypothetical protein QOJ39_3516 [Candidatus Eremiobacteraeota bacterium]|jgi:hypothetical protein|nr:hypothetical protein [Candidatus Eremiobacteraeota bacterium]